MAAPGPPPDPFDPNKYSFKGHPQPSVNDRLETAKNFLADEDPDRFLNFQDKFTEIEEFVADVEKEPRLAYDAAQLRDVKIMLEEHRDWQKTVDAGWKDIKCRDRVPKNPFSNRLINTDTVDFIKEEGRALGINGQMRDDAPPFTTEREDDHDDFLRAMRSDVMQNPDEVDESKNLLYIESKAYSWAMQDPAFIPYWMHPTKGILKKGLSDVDDKPWYMTPLPLPFYIKNRPDRGFMPDYLIKRENRINALLKVRKPTSQQFKELEDLLSYHYPDDLKILHDQYHDFLETDGLDGSVKTPYQLNKQESKKRDIITAAFQDAQLKWVQSFASIGLYLVVRKPWKEVEVELPGVFYVDDGVLSDAQIATHRQADRLINQLITHGNWNHLSAVQKRQMEVLLHDCQSQDVRDLEKKRDDILTIWGVDRVEDLENFPQLQWESLDTQAYEARINWFKKIRADGVQLEVRYLRPAEIKEDDPKFIHLPWSMDSMPDGTSPNLDCKVPPEVIELQAEINKKLSDGNVNRSIGDDGTVDFQNDLIQVAYPKLRRLLIPWIIIRDKMDANEQISPNDKATFDILDPEVRKLWNDWVSTLGTEVKVKMARSQMKAETPDVLYWRLPTTGNDDPDVLARKNTKAINDLLQTDLSTQDSAVSDKFMDEAKILFEDLQYPALKKAYDDYEQALKPDSVSKETPINLLNKWDKKLQTWIYGKLGHTLSIKRPLPFSDPDDDPQVVYFHGALLDTRSTKRIRDRMDLTKSPEEVIQQLEGFHHVHGVGDLVPPYFRYLQRCAQDSGSPIDKLLLDWHSDFLLHGPLTDTSVMGLAQDSDNTTDTAIWRNAYVDKDGVVKNFKAEPTEGSPFIKVEQISDSSQASSSDDSPTSQQSNTTNSSLSSNFSRSSAGYHSRALAKRIVQRQADFGIDLEQFRPHFAAIENEVNAIFYRMNSTQEAPPETERTKLNMRLDVLLEPFAPDNLVNAWKKFTLFRNMMQVPGTMPVAALRKKEYYQGEELARSITRLLVEWKLRLQRSPNGVYVQMSTKPEDEFDGAALILNPRQTGRSTNFRLHAPKDLSAPIGTSEVIEYQPLNVEKLDVYYKDKELRTKILRRLMDRINVLLKKRRRSDPLNREDSEELLDKLLGFMSPSLLKIESELWELDQKVRDVTIPRNLDDEERFERLNISFNSLYDKWLDGFPPQGIWICTVDLPEEKVTQPGPLFLEDPKFWDYWTQKELDGPVETLSCRRPRRSWELPKHIKVRLEMSNQYLEGTLSHENIDEVELILKLTYRHVGQPLRIQIHAELNRQLGESLRPEEAVVMETMQSLAFRGWKNYIKRTFEEDRENRLPKNQKAIRIVEFVPGRYYTYFGIPLRSEDNLTSPYPPGAESFWDSIAEDYITTYWGQLANLANAFLKFAARVRNQSRLTADEISALRLNILNLGNKTQETRENLVIGVLDRPDIINVFPPLTSDQQAILAREYRDILMDRWVRSYAEIVEHAASMPVLRTVDRLIVKARPGEPFRSGVPVIATPSKCEIRELEIELNNLLTRERSKTIQPREQEELDFLLRSLLPPNLQMAKERLDKLHESYVTLPGLNMSETIQYNRYQQRYKQEFAAFKQNLEPRGILLDRWWYPADVTAQACSRARMWKEATEKDVNAGTYPATSSSLEDEHIGQWHGLYQEMKDYADTENDNTVNKPAKEARLLFDSMPEHLITLGKEIHNSKELVSKLPAATSNEETRQRSHALAWVEDLIGQFVRAWTRWIVGMPPSQLNSLRSAAGGNLRSNTGGNTSGGGALNNGVGVNFSSKAERRGIKRAAIELALNLLATNQEQHRPLDIYRNLDLPGKYHSIDEGVPLCLPLEPWQRPVEQDPFHYTKKLTAFHQAKESEYNNARTQQENSHPSELPVPANYMGPIAPADTRDVEEAKRRWLAHLAQVNVRLQHANLDATRPLLQELLLCYVAGSNLQRDPDDVRDQDVRLTIHDVNLLNELAEPSWDELRQKYPEPTPNTIGYAALLKQQQDDKNFEQELNVLDWSGRTWQPGNNWNTTNVLAQRPYQQNVDSVQGYSITDLAQAITNARLDNDRAAGAKMASPLISREETADRLGRLQTLRRIHLNKPANDPFETLVAKIPLSGHPENKYILSRDAVQRSPGVFFDAVRGEYQVRYDANGKMGPPIVQPNKYEHLRSIAYRIGRDTSDALKTRSAPKTSRRLLVHEQIKALQDTRLRMLPEGKEEEDVQNMALELHKIAPYLAPEHAIVVDKEPPKIEPSDAAMLLQMQMLEEISNAWEPRFPGQSERLWSFADDRVAPQTTTINGRTVQPRRRITQFFDVRRFPACCQDTATKTAIAQSGPQLQTRTSTTTTNTTVPVQQTPAEQRAEALKKNVRHIQGQRPHFPFGETPYQQAYQSFCMEWDLADVPEFQAPPAPRRGLFAKRPSPEPADPFGLPPIPPNWQPDNISAAEKRAQLIEAAKNTPGFPNPNILENYHTPAEIRAMKQREAFDKIQHELELAQDSIVALVNEGYAKNNKKTFAQLTPQEFSQACDRLQIDKQTGRFRPDDSNKKTPEKKTPSIWDWFRKVRQGGSTGPEKENEKAKWHTEQDTGDAAANEGGGAAPEEKAKQESQDYGPEKPKVSKESKVKKKKSKEKTPDLQASVEDTEDEEIKQEQRGFDGTSKSKGSNKRAAPLAPRRTSPRKRPRKAEA